jgi:hypothetical protein
MYLVLCKYNFLITSLFLNYNWKYHYQEERWGGLTVGILFWTLWHFATICIFSVHMNLIKLRNMPDRQASQTFAFLPRTNKFHSFGNEHIYCTCSKQSIWTKTDTTTTWRLSGLFCSYCKHHEHTRWRYFQKRV